jgi:hypothetical protein
MKYIKTSQGGVYCIQTLDMAIEELKEFYENAMPKDVLETSIVELTKEEYEKLPEFSGY